MSAEDLDETIEVNFFGPIGRNPPRPFSTDLTTAGLLLDKLHRDGWFYRIDSVPAGAIVTVQCLTPNGKDPKNPERKTFQVGAATIPLAICEAALKTK